MANAQLTDKQKQKIRKIADVVKNGEMSIVEFIFELEDRLDQELPSLHKVFEKIKGDKGDTYNLSDDDLRKIAVQARSLINISQLGKLAAGMVSVPVEEISQKVAKIIGKPKDGKTPTQEELEPIIRALMPEAIRGEDGLDADEEAIYDRIIQDLPMLGTAFRDGLELLEGDDRLDISAIKGWEELIRELRGSGKSVNIGGGPRGLHIYVDGVKYGLISTINFEAGNNITLDFAKNSSGIPTLTINSTGGGGTTSGWTAETPPEVPNGIITDFTASEIPQMVVSDGVSYFSGLGYTYLAGTVTMDIPPSQYIRIIVESATANTIETPPEVPNAVIVEFTVSDEPEFVIADGVTYFDGSGYVYNAGTGKITMSIAPSSFIRAIM